MAQITYDDKSAINVNSSVPNVNKVNASDMNEIKSVVNTNYTETNNELDKRANYMVAVMTSSQSLASDTTTTLNINKVIASNGNLLSLNTSSHAIVIGAGVHNVEISGQFYQYTISGNGARNIYIYKNNDIVARALVVMSNPYQTVGSQSKAISVTEGDKIYIKVNSQGGTMSVSENTSSTYLYVKVIN